MDAYLFILFYCLIVLLFLSLFFPSANIFFQLGILLKYTKVRYESEYFRDILTYSPSEIYYIYNKNFKLENIFDFSQMQKYRKLLLINILKMNLLGYIKIDFTDKNNFKIIKNNNLILDEEYKYIYDFIFGTLTFNNEITLYEIYDYVNQNYKDSSFKNWDKLIKEKIKRRYFYDGDFITFYRDKIKTFYKINIPILIIIDIVVMFLNFLIGIALIFIIIILLVAGYFESKNIKVISNVGIYEYRKIIALKKFLKDFSIIEERGPECSEVLEDYIVYASIFDILKEKRYRGNTKALIKYFLYK